MLVEIKAHMTNNIGLVTVNSTTMKRKAFLGEQFLDVVKVWEVVWATTFCTHQISSCTLSLLEIIFRNI